MAEQMKLYRVTDPEFAPYGTVHHIDCDELIAEAAKIGMPENGSKYEASVAALEKPAVVGKICDLLYGELPIQVGYCWGYNTELAALEWHKSSELNIAVTDFVLLLGKLDEMCGARFDSKKVKAFLVNKGETVEVYATTLHFCPCTDEACGFGCIVVLPKGTNMPLDRVSSDPLLFRKNKWIICRDESEGLKSRGVAVGLD